MNAFRVNTVIEVQNIVKPVEDYFLSRVNLGEDVRIYKALRNANHLAVRRSPPSALEFTEDVESLDHFTATEIKSMVVELSKYLDLAENSALAIGHSDKISTIIKFWNMNMEHLPAITKFVRYAYTITTSSAAAERVFSVIKRSFDTSQKGALEDYVFLSAVMQYNKLVGIQELRVI